MISLLPTGAHIWPQMVQQSDEWFNARMGRPTASMFSMIITPSTGKLSSSRLPLIHKLVGQCFARDEVPKFTGSYWTDRGNELEAAARATFARDMGFAVDQVGFVTNDRWGNVAGASPDGLIRPIDRKPYLGGMEIKCLMAQNHVAIWDEEKMPDEYKPQVHGGMAVTGLPYWWFVAYHPAMRPFYQKIEWDSYTDKVVASLDLFIEEYAEKRKELKAKLKPSPVETGVEEEEALL